MTTTTTLPSLREKSLTIRDLLLKNKEQIALALPRFMNVDRLIRTALTCFAVTPGLLDCTPRSLLGAVIQSAQLGLEPGMLGMAYLVPFRNTKAGTTEVQFLPGYKGLLSLARRSGDISTIQAHCVYAEDAFKYRYGLDPQLDHTPAEKANRGPMTHVYAVARLKDGGVQYEVMTTAEVDAHRDRYSRAAKTGPWQIEYPEMAKKTVLRRLCKLLPASVELQTAVALDERAELQLPQGLTELALPTPEPSETAPVATLDRLAEELKAAPSASTQLASPPSNHAPGDTPAETEIALLRGQVADLLAPYGTSAASAMLKQAGLEHFFTLGAPIDVAALVDFRDRLRALGQTRKDKK